VCTTTETVAFVVGHNEIVVRDCPFCEEEREFYPAYYPPGAA
jgi:hypothetical protein